MSSKLNIQFLCIMPIEFFLNQKSPPFFYQLKCYCCHFLEFPSDRFVKVYKLDALNIGYSILFKILIRYFIIYVKILCSVCLFKIIRHKMHIEKNPDLQEKNGNQTVIKTVEPCAGSSIAACESMILSLKTSLNEAPLQWSESGSSAESKVIFRVESALL